LQAGTHSRSSGKAGRLRAILGNAIAILSATPVRSKETRRKITKTYSVALRKSGKSGSMIKGWQDRSPIFSRDTCPHRNQS
jgi:hypothetical protein